MGCSGSVPENVRNEIIESKRNLNTDTTTNSNTSFYNSKNKDNNINYYNSNS